MTAGIGYKVAICLIAIASSLWSIPTIAPMTQGVGDEWGYHNSSQIADVMESLATAHPDRARYTTAEKELGKHVEDGEVTIPLLMFGHPGANDKPTVMLIGAHHGNEPDSAEGVLAFAYHILQTKDRVNSMVLDNVNIIVLPVVNPYGLDNGVRVDENGEDPNRDYPFAPSPSSSDSDGRPLTTDGAYAVHNLARRYPISVALSFHTGSWGIFSPWGAKGMGNITPDHRSMTDMARALSKASAQNMPYGPANDFTGISYLYGAFDDDLYGSSIDPEKVYTRDHVLPYSTATFTVELRTGFGRVPSDLGSPAEMAIPIPSARSIPTAIRICLAACVMSVNAIEPSKVGSEVEFTVLGSGSDNVLVLQEIGYDGSVTIVGPDSIEVDPIYPFSTFTVVPGERSTCVCLGGNLHPGWADDDLRADPRVSPRSLLSMAAFSEVQESVFLEIDPGPPILRIEPIGTDPIVGTGFIVQYHLSTIETVHNLTFHLMDSLGHQRTILAETVMHGENQIWIRAPESSGRAVLTAVLTTDTLEHTVSIAFLVRPNLVWAVDDDICGEMDVLYELFGADDVQAGFVRLDPIGSSIDGVRTYPILLYPGKGTAHVNISEIHGRYNMSVWIPPYREGDPVAIDVWPFTVVSGVPIRIESDRVIIGPVTAYIGNVPVKSSGEFGNNTVTVEFHREGAMYRVELMFIPFDNMSDIDRRIAQGQALLARSDPSLLQGAFFGEWREPVPGEYTSFCLFNNHAGGTTAPTEGPYSEGISYGTFTIEDGDKEFPYLMVVMFISLMAIMLVISYMRFTAKMESLVRKERMRKDQERKEIGNRRQRR